MVEVLTNSERVEEKRVQQRERDVLEKIEETREILDSIESLKYHRSACENEYELIGYADVMYVLSLRALSKVTDISKELRQQREDFAYAVTDIYQEKREQEDDS